MYSERMRSTKIQQRLAEEREKFETQRGEFLRNRKRLVTSALSFGAGPQSEIPEESDDEGGFMIRDPMTKEAIAVQDMITLVNISQDIPTIVEIAFPDDHLVILPQVQQDHIELFRKLWDLSGRKTLAEINKISTWDTNFTIEKPRQLKAKIDDLSK